MASGHFWKLQFVVHNQVSINETLLHEEISQYRQGGNLFSAIEHQQMMSNEIVGILKLRELIDWELFRSTIEAVSGYAKKDWSKGGRPPFDPVLMFKVLVLQKYHGLSDEAAERQIKDRLSFMSFLGLRLCDEVLDARTIWDFKERIEAACYLIDFTKC